MISNSSNTNFGPMLRPNEYAQKNSRKSVKPFRWSLIAITMIGAH